MLVLDVNLCAV